MCVCTLTQSFGAQGHIPRTMESKNLIYPKRQNVDLGARRDIQAWNIITTSARLGNMSISFSLFLARIECVQEHLHYDNIIICVTEIY